ncbi:MAG: hypothetical protein C0491_05505 [Novosphingobium sp.]|nr:hypothetical protein [Novosphingobium sp.]
MHTAPASFYPVRWPSHFPPAPRRRWSRKLRRRLRPSRPRHRPHRHLPRPSRTGAMRRRPWATGAMSRAWPASVRVTPRCSRWPAIEALQR